MTPDTHVVVGENRRTLGVETDEIQRVPILPVA
jgi:hypothetical protein